MMSDTTVVTTEAHDLLTVLRARATREGERVVYTHLRDGEEDAVSMTFAELWARAVAIAGALRSAGLSGERALLLYPPGLDYAPTLFGCFLAGVVAVPEGPPDRRRPERSLPRIRAVTRNARAEAVLTVEGLLDVRGAMPESVAGTRWIATDRLPIQETADPGVMPDPDALAYLQYTSGSTADPKGVMLTHRHLAANCRAIVHTYRPSADSVMVSWVPTFHDLGLVYGIAMPVWSGFRGVSLAAGDFARHPMRWLRAIHRYRGTHSIAPDVAYAITALKSRPEDRVGLDLSSWQMALNGAEPVRAVTEERFVRAFADQGFRADAFSHSWGLSEATAKLTGERAGQRMQFIALDADALASHRVCLADASTERTIRLASCGTTAAGTTVRIVDPGSHAPLPADAVGEVWVRGPSVGLGYWEAPDLTAETFGARTNDGDGPFLRTGDLGFLHDGRLFIAGRIKEILIIRGQNHYPQDLEASIAGRHPAIRPGGTVAFSYEDPIGEQVAIVAEVRPDRVDDPERVYGAIRAGLAEHGLRPTRIALVGPGAVPRTTSGKLQRRKTLALLHEGALAPLHDWVAADTEPAAPDPTVSLVDRVRALVAEIAGVRPVAAAGRRLDELGFDSMMLATLAARLADEGLGGLTTGELYDRPDDRTIADRLTATLAPARPTDTNRLVRLVEAIEQVDDDTWRDAGLWRRLTDRFSRGCTLVASPGQTRLWLIEQVRDLGPTYHVLGQWHTHDPIDEDTLAEALHHIARRHAVLRAGFVYRDGQLELRITDAPHVSFVRKTLDSGDAALDAALESWASKPFELERPPLWRACLFDQGPEGIVFALVWHHILVDGRAVGTLLEDLERCYEAARLGRRPPAPTGFDYPEFLRRPIKPSGAARERLRAYWKTALEGVSTLELPVDRSPPGRVSHRGGQIGFRFEAARRRRVEQLAGVAGCTPAAVLLTAWSLVIARASHRRDLVVGTVLDGRTRPGFARTVGFFARTVPIRFCFSEAATVIDALRATADRLAEAMKNGALPYDEIVEVSPMSGLDESVLDALIQAMFVFEGHSGLDTWSVGDARLVDRALGAGGDVSGTAKFPLTLAIMRSNDAYRASIEFAADLFEESTVEALRDRWLHLLDELADDPMRSVRAMGAPVEAARLQDLGNPAPAAWPGHTVVERFFEVAARTPDRAAVIVGARSMTYAELAAQARRLARGLRGHGVGPGDRVGLHVGRGWELPVSLLGALAAGAAIVPMDPGYPAERLRHMAHDAGVRCVMSDDPGKTQWASDYPILGAADIAAAGDGHDDDIRGSHPSVDDLAYIIYTSGSTGRPKGVMVPHGSLAAVLHEMRALLRPEPGERVFSVTTLSFDPFMLDFFGPLMGGGVVDLIPRAMQRDPAALITRIVETRPTVMQATPVLWRMLSDAGLPAGCAPRILCGGEAMDVGLARTLAEWSPEVHNIYGPTEITLWATAWRVPPAARSVRVGRPFSGVRCRVVAANGEPCAVGESGELWLGGPRVALGYCNRPELTADRFVDDAAEQTRWYRTGDRVRWDADGQLVFLGRLDRQIKLRGHRIELDEIESVLGQHPRVGQCAVILRGEGALARLVAWFEPIEGATIEADQLRAWLARRLPEPMVPEGIVPLSRMPLTFNGKIDRPALATMPDDRQSMIAAGVEGTSSPRSRRVESAEIELRVREAVVDVLALRDAAAVPADVPLRALGLNSLTAVGLRNRLEQAFERTLPVTIAFDHPTIEAIVAVLSVPPGEKPPTPERAPSAGDDRAVEPSVLRAKLETVDLEALMASGLAARLLDLPDRAPRASAPAVTSGPIAGEDDDLFAMAEELLNG